MLRLHRALMAMLMLSITASAEDVAVGQAPVLDDRYPRAHIEFAGAVESFPDLVFSRPQGFRPLRLDLYRPQQSRAKGYPLVVYIHGGGWQSGHTRHSGAFENWPQVLAALAAKGFVVVSLEYRLSNEAAFPAAIQDVKTAIRWLRANAADFAVDRERAVVWGGSAGGQLAALAATSCRDARLQPSFTAAEAKLANESDCVQGLVAWYGMFDFKLLPELTAARNDASAASAATRYLRCTGADCGDRVTQASPISHIDATTPRTLLIHGDRDAVVSVEQSRQFHQALQRAHVPSELVVIEGVDHSFIGSTPAATREASLQALSKTFAFIEATVGGAGT